MDTTTTANVHDDTPIDHAILGVSAAYTFASLRLGADGQGRIALLVEDPDDLERLAAECLAAANQLRAAKAAAA